MKTVSVYPGIMLACALIVIVCASTFATNQIQKASQSSTGTQHGEPGKPAPPPDTSKPKQAEPPPDLPGHIHYLDYKNGFREVHFGTSVTQFTNLQLERQRGPIKVYRKGDDKLTLGNAELKNIYYYFLDDKFFAVTLIADERTMSDLLKVFQAAFGPGERPRTALLTRVWQSNAPPAQFFWKAHVASAHLIQNDQAHTVEGWIGNNELETQYEKAMDEIVKQAAEQL